LPHCELLNRVEAKGVRLTTQRRTLIKTVQEAKTHLNAASLLKQARERDPNIDRAAVYRTIELLKKLGMMEELHLMYANGEKHYSQVRTEQASLRLAFFECGEVTEFSTPAFEPLKQEIVKRNGFEIEPMHFEVGGLCAACTAKKSERLQ
jgi:Fur family transcriptional regulator, ferric uptake regulator